MIATLILIVWFSPSSSESGKSKVRVSLTEHEAKLVAETQVKLLLKSPKTAEFSGLRDTGIKMDG